MNLFIACKFLLTNEFCSNSWWMSSPQAVTLDNRISRAKVEGFDLDREKKTGKGCDLGH